MTANISALRAAFVLSIAATIAFALASCGGGGGGGGTINPPPPNASPLPSGSPYPSNNGDTFSYAGTSVQTVSRSVPTPTPPPSTTTSTVTQNQTVKTGQTFHGTSATDFQTVETDVGPNQTITTNSDDYFVFPGASGNVVQIGFKSTDSNGVTLNVQYLSGNGIIDQLPETQGANWSNSAAESLTENDPDGSQVVEAINADGSYTETQTLAAGTANITENSDGTGTATFPTLVFFGVGTGTQFAIGAQSGGIIPITVSAIGAPTPTPPPILVPVPAWYQASPTLASDMTTNDGTASLPSGCAAHAYPGIGIQLHEARTRLDTILGYQETETQDRWIVPSVGPTCAKITDTIVLFYDFTGQTVTDVFNSTGVQTTGITETLGLQSATISNAARHALDRRSSALAFAAQLELGRARVERFRQTVRRHQLMRLKSFLERKALR